MDTLWKGENRRMIGGLGRGTTCQPPPPGRSRSASKRNDSPYMTVSILTTVASPTESMIGGPVSAVFRSSPPAT